MQHNSKNLGYLHGYLVTRSDQSAGTYELTHVATQKVYVGSTTNIYSRCVEHMSRLAKGTRHNQDMQDAYNQSPFFELSFTPAPLEHRELLIQGEQNLIDLYKDSGFLLNRSTDAEVSARGYARTEEHLSKLIEGNLGRAKSPEEREKHRLGKLGKKLSDETKEKISQARTGKPRYRAIEIEEKSYPSIVSAARELDISPKAIAVRLKSNNPAFEHWQYKDIS
jgi:group I intron endonuclease